MHVNMMAMALNIQSQKKQFKNIVTLAEKTVNYRHTDEKVVK